MGGETSLLDSIFVVRKTWKRRRIDIKNT